ncbi:MAG: YIP1 family protein [Pyrinomonadaceae bacterium]
MSESSAQTVEMSTPQTLSGIFFEPGRTFEALRSRPRFLAAAVLGLVLFMSFYLLYMTRVGYENVVNAGIEMQAQRADMSDEDKAKGRDIQLKPVVKAIRYGSPVLVFAIITAAGGAIYMLGVMAMGKKVSYKQALAVWSYSSFPPLLIAMLANIIILFLRPPDPSDYTAVARGLGGLVHANPGAFMASTANPILVTALGAFDLFAFYGLFLAALGLRKVGRLSAGAAWGIVIALWLVGLIVRLAIAALTHTPAG